MPEQAQKLLHFTDNVLKTATEESEALARELEAKRQAALTEARQTSRDDAHAYTSGSPPGSAPRPVRRCPAT